MRKSNYHHLCQKGRDEVIEEELYRGTSKSSEGFVVRVTFQKVKEEGMHVAIHWQDADSSLAKAVREVFLDAEIMIYGSCWASPQENIGVMSED